MSDSEAAKSQQRGLKPWAPGQSGNPAGRAVGSRNKLSTQFFDDFYAAWLRDGKAALESMARDKPNEFVRAATMLMPKEIELKTPLSELSDDELADLITAVRTISAAAIADKPRERSEAKTRH